MINLQSKGLEIIENIGRFEINMQGSLSPFINQYSSADWSD